jgi:hypothetical protein
MTTRRKWLTWAAFALGSCQQQPQETNAPTFLVEAQSRSSVPELVMLRIKNVERSPICFAISDFEVGGDMIKIVPSAASDYADNRPPPVVMNGMNISEGLYVLPAGASRDFYLDVSRVVSRVPPAQSIRGTARAVFCRSLFSPSSPSVGIKGYQAPLFQRSTSARAAEHSR